MKTDNNNDNNNNNNQGINLSDGLLDLLVRWLVAEPGARPSVVQIMRHAWFDDVRGIGP